MRMYSHFSERLSLLRKRWSKNPDCHLKRRRPTSALNALTHSPIVVSDAGAKRQEIGRGRIEYTIQPALATWVAG
ncbi:MAG: hypothetical protein KAU94_03610 [Verrucomicrobia bacterium]|nr:hypothetical protein [Verrucomicrobiota bacterium]